MKPGVHLIKDKQGNIIGEAVYKHGTNLNYYFYTNVTNVLSDNIFKFQKKYRTTWSNSC